MYYLRPYRYQFGKNELASQLITQNQIDYKDPGIFQIPLFDKTNSLNFVRWFPRDI